MERTTQKDECGYYLVGDGIYSDWGTPEKFRGDEVDRLAAYEDTGLEPEQIRTVLDDAAREFAEYDAMAPKGRLRELAKADRLLGKKVYEPNKRGFVSTYEVISVHISYCSVLVGWNLIDGIYSNLNGFEISALGKSVFLTREEAESALRGEQDG